MASRVLAGFVLGAGLSGLLSVGCSDSDPAPTPHRVFLGIEANPRGVTDPLLTEAYLDVQQGGFPLAQCSIDWAEVEPLLEERNWQPLDAHLRLARVRDVRLSVQLLIIDHQVRGGVPSQIDSLWIDHPFLRQRLATFVADLVRRGGDRIDYLWIGREADVYLAEHPGELGLFLSTLRACRDSVAAVRPALPVGTTVAYGEALGGGWLNLTDSLLTAVDRLGLTVYGRDRNFLQTLSPEQTMDRLRQAVSRYPTAQLIVTEVGFPRLGDSNAGKEEFARLLTQYLEDAPPQLGGVIWSPLYDLHVTQAQARAERLFADEPERLANYRTQLQSLGLKGVTGSLNPAWLHVRDWNHGLPGASPKEIFPGTARILAP